MVFGNKFKRSELTAIVCFIKKKIIVVKNSLKAYITLTVKINYTEKRPMRNSKNVWVQHYHLVSYSGKEIRSQLPIYRKAFVRGRLVLASATTMGILQWLYNESRYDLFQ